MSNVCYDAARYAQLRKTYNAWWNNELDRPIVSIITKGHPTTVKPTDTPLLAFHTAWDPQITPQMFIDAYDYDFSISKFHGDCFPRLNTSRFGAGVLAAFLGCEPIPSPETTWFLPRRKDIPLDQLHFEYDKESPWLRRILDFIECGMERWKGDVVICMPDLGGVLDVLASFRSAQDLLLDLYDDPDEVKRCIKEIQSAWFECFEHINSYLKPGAQGYSDWFGLYYDEPGYILQSDFSYMISPDMFREFVGWDLADSGSRMKHTVYHMDGVGQIPHLDQLTAIDSIDAIQFVPGIGSHENDNFDHVFSAILKSGKKLVSRSQKQDGSPFDAVKNHLGQLYFQPRTYALDNLDAARAYAEMYNIPLDL